MAVIFTKHCNQDTHMDIQTDINSSKTLLLDALYLL